MAPHGHGKWIVPASIDNDKSQPGRPIDRLEDPIEPYCFILRVPIARKPCVDRDQIVAAVQLQAVSGKKHHRNIGPIGRVLEFAEGAFELQIAYVEPQIDDVEPGALEHPGHSGRIIRRIGQSRHILVAGVSDQQRDPPVGQGRVARNGQEKEARDESRNRDQAPRQNFPAPKGLKATYDPRMRLCGNHDVDAGEDKAQH